jgi:hypothetical protein
MKRFSIIGLAAFAATVALGVGSLALAQSSKDGAKDKDKLREMLRNKADALHKEVLDGNTAKPVSPEQEDQAAAAQAASQPPAPAEQPIGEGPRLVFENNTHDFGIVMGEQSLVCKFTFKNRGSQKLVINAINTGCGCTVAKLAKQEFEPNEGDTVEITYNPKGAGKQQRTIQVSSNDAQQPNMQLTISAQVVPLIEARPNTVQFGQVSIGEARTVQLVVVSRDPELKITGIESNGPEIVAEVAPAGTKPEVMVEPELPGIAVINVTLKDSAPVGRVLRMLTIKAMAAKDKGGTQEVQEIKVNSFAAVKGELTINPQLLRVPPVAANGDISRDAIITRKDNKPFNVSKAEILDSTLPGLSVAAEPYKEGELTGFKIRLSGKAGPSANNFRGRIVLSTDVPREETVEVQFSGIVRVPPPTGEQPSGNPPVNNPTGTTPPPVPAPAPSAPAPASKPQ